MMKPASISILLSFVALAQAHTRVWSVWVDGVDQGQGAGVYIRQPPSNSPVKDLTSADVRCNVNGLSAVPSTISVPAGATLEPEWFHDNRGDDIIDPSHKGPVVVYLAPADTNGEGNVWVKIAEDGYDGTQWAVDKLIANKGKHSVTIPSSLAAGEYILRAEILALHESDTLFTENSARGIQLYPSCSQITVTGSGVVALPAGVSFPGEYKDSDPGIHFNLYSEDPNSYQIPGPSVWDGTGDPAPTSSTSTSVATATTSASTSSTTSSVLPSTTSTASLTSSKPPSTSTPLTTITSTTTSSASNPTKSPAACTKDALNCCWDAYNACADRANRAHAGKGGDVDFSACAHTRENCVSAHTSSARRHPRMWLRKSH